MSFRANCCTVRNHKVWTVSYWRLGGSKATWNVACCRENPKKNVIRSEWEVLGPSAHVLRGPHVGCVHHGARTHADASSASEMAADGGSSSLQLPCVFSPKSRQFLALCAQDGRLRIWNTDSKTLHQEYVPSAHLSATCTCIAWGPCRTVKVREAVVSVSS